MLPRRIVPWIPTLKHEIYCKALWKPGSVYQDSVRLFLRKAGLCLLRVKVLIFQGQNTEESEKFEKN